MGFGEPRPMLLPEVEALASGWVGAAGCPKIPSSVELNEARAEDVAGVAMGSRGGGGGWSNRNPILKFWGFS